MSKITSFQNFLLRKKLKLFSIFPRKIFANNFNNRAIRIDSWYGRFGNNFQQILNASYLSKKYNLELLTPYHELFKKIHLNKSLFYNSNYFYSSFYKFNNHYEEIKKNVSFLTENIIKPNFKISTKLQPYCQETLVIHIRSGDLWNSDIKNSNYLQNPLSYYLKLIKKFKNVIIVTEGDLKNPIIGELLNHDNVILKSNGIKEDIKIILKARNLASSGVGTFIIALSLLSENLERFYFSNLYLKEHINPTFLLGSPKLKLFRLDIYNYLKFWNNTFIDNQILLKHNLLDEDFKKVQ